jgi:hypothetical protein
MKSASISALGVVRFYLFDGARRFTSSDQWSTKFSLLTCSSGLLSGRSMMKCWPSEAELTGDAVMADHLWLGAQGFIPSAAHSQLLMIFSEGCASEIRAITRKRFPSGLGL